MSTKRIDPQAAIDAMLSTAPLLAQAKATRVYMDEYRKILKARLMRDHIGKPLAAQERDAYADEKYIAHVQAQRIAVEEEERLRWVMIAREAEIEVWRSQEASNRMIVGSAR